MSYNYEDAWNKLRKELPNLVPLGRLGEAVVDCIERKMEEFEERIVNKELGG